MSVMTMPVAPGRDPVFSTQDRFEEGANIVTHGLGAVLAVIGLVAAVAASAAAGGPTRVVTVAVFGLALVLTYVASTGFHLSARSAARRHWRLLDHASIYTLIAGTYTPLMLVGVGGAWGWSVTGVVWGLALVGVVVKTVLVGRFDAFERIDTLLYLAMGWLCVVAIVPIYTSLSATAFGLMLAGGLAYSAGCVFFLWDRLRFNHGIWHLFVLTGSACHFGAVWVDVVRA